VIGLGPTAPWTKAQVCAAAACDVAAAACIAGAALAAGGPSLRDQILWLDVGVLGLVLAVLVNGAMLLLGRRTVGQRRLRLLPNPAPGVAAATSGSDAWLWLPGTTRAHSGTCQMIEGKPSIVIDADRIRAEALVRCEVCR
jgi:hypothetical protein